MKNKKIYSIAILFLIISIATLKPHIVSSFDPNPDPKGIIKSFSKDSKNQRLNEKWNKNLVGYSVYYVLYLSCHITFICLVFHDNKRVRNWLIVALISIVIILALTLIISKLSNSDKVTYIAYDLWNKLVGLPIILLAIEGGRILYKDIKKYTEKLNSN